MDLTPRLIGLVYSAVNHPIFLSSHALSDQGYVLKLIGSLAAWYPNFLAKEMTAESIP